MNYLILRIANFDLSPLSFLTTSAHILMTVFVAWVLRQVVAAPAPEGIAVAILLGVAFLSGLYPLLGLNVLIDRLPSWLRFKRDIAEAGQIGRSFPLDLIDGIDPSIGFRLNELDFGDVQNLATANPVELLVETPYSFGQILDWMAQAQLLAELGPQHFLAAREHGVRDMAAFLDLGRTENGRALLRPLLSTAEEPDDLLRARIDSIARSCTSGSWSIGGRCSLRRSTCRRSDHGRGRERDAVASHLLAALLPRCPYPRTALHHRPQGRCRQPQPARRTEVGRRRSQTAPRAASPSHALHDDRFELDPATGTAWTKASEHALEAGVEVVASWSGGQLRAVEILRQSTPNAKLSQQYDGLVTPTAAARSTGQQTVESCAARPWPGARR